MNSSLNEIQRVVRLEQLLLLCQTNFLYRRTAPDKIRPSGQAPAEILSVNGNRKSADRPGK